MALYVVFLMKKAWFSVLAIIPFLIFSCSLDYGTQDSQQKRVLPEMILSDVKFTRVEKLAETASFEAEVLEIFKEDDTIYGSNITFKSFDNRKVAAYGVSDFIKIDNRTYNYLLLGNTNIHSVKNGIDIYSDSLKWNDRTKQLTADSASAVTVHKAPDKGSNASLSVTGTGFAFSALSLDYVFDGRVTASIDTKK